MTTSSQCLRSRRAAGARLVWILLCAGYPFHAAQAQQPSAVEAPGAPPFASAGVLHQGGVLQESYGFHRGGGHAWAPPTITPQQGWYGYGFPVSSHRWGWFGASRYYPTVVGHRGYNGDTVRWAHRQGY